jgi:DNA-binding NarL/FixJ family response regulator
VDGGTALDPEVVTLMMTRTRRGDEALDRMTPRRREVLALIAEGLTNAAIARRLAISEKAVVVHTSGTTTPSALQTTATSTAACTPSSAISGDDRR